VKKEIIIVGAGAAGLMAAAELCRKNYGVTVLEARDRIGGRMHTLMKPGFDKPFEEGAEFIHGKMPLSRALLEETQTHYEPMSGRFWRSHLNKLETDRSFIEDDSGLVKKLKEVETDITIKEFLEKYFDREKDSVLIHSIKSFVEGYDAADYDKLSTFAFRDEWLKEDESHQFRISGGYKKIYDHLEDGVVKNGGKIILGKIVNKIEYGNKSATVFCGDNSTYDAEKIIVTVPTGVLKNKNKNSSIRFIPGIPRLDEWLTHSGYGSLIKIILQFAHPFWDNSVFEKQNILQASGMAFLFSEKKIPTWWTQLPDKNALLTGWLAGPKAEKLKDETDENILQLAMESLSEIFRIHHEQLRSELKGWHIKNWTNDPFTLGAYAYKTPETDRLLKIISKPVDDIIYFGGEAFYEGKEMGTVEAALVNGLNIAKSISNE
jgi:monoamine oxidase